MATQPPRAPRLTSPGDGPLLRPPTSGGQSVRKVKVRGVASPASSISSRSRARRIRYPSDAGCRWSPWRPPVDQAVRRQSLAAVQCQVRSAMSCGPLSALLLLFLFIADGLGASLAGSTGGRPNRTEAAAAAVRRTAGEGRPAADSGKVAAEDPPARRRRVFSISPVELMLRGACGPAPGNRLFPSLLITNAVAKDPVSE